MGYVGSHLFKFSLFFLSNIEQWWACKGLKLRRGAAGGERGQWWSTVTVSCLTSSSAVSSVSSRGRSLYLNGWLTWRSYFLLLTGWGSCQRSHDFWAQEPEKRDPFPPPGWHQTESTLPSWTIVKCFDWFPGTTNPVAPGSLLGCCPSPGWPCFFHPIGREVQWHHPQQRWLSIQPADTAVSCVAFRFTAKTGKNKYKFLSFSFLF